MILITISVVSVIQHYPLDHRVRHRLSGLMGSAIYPVSTDSVV